MTSPEPDDLDNFHVRGEAAWEELQRTDVSYSLEKVLKRLAAQWQPKLHARLKGELQQVRSRGEAAQQALANAQRKASLDRTDAAGMTDERLSAVAKALVEQAGRAEEPLLPTVFLDLDDVMCLSSPYGGFDVVHLFSGKRHDHEEVYSKLFACEALNTLKRAHAALDGQLRYVISSTWRIYLEREQLEEVLRRSGLEFVADCLYPDARWMTGVRLSQWPRCEEIEQWLARHHRGEPWVVIDDLRSGSSLRPAALDPQHPWHGRVVLCEQDVGLRPQHLEAIVAALRSSPR